MIDEAEKIDEIDALIGDVTDAAKSAAPKVKLDPALFFRVGQRWFMVPVANVGEVVVKGSITRVPRLPRHVLGVTLVHGRLVAVVAIEELLGAVGEPPMVATLPRLVILSAKGLEVGVVAEETRGVVEIDATPVSRGGQQRGFIVADIRWQGGVAHRLDVSALIAASSGIGDA